MKHCETRLITLAKGGVITVDPGENGGVRVEGWSRDSIEVHARIQTQGATDEDAVALRRRSARAALRCVP